MYVHDVFYYTCTHVYAAVYNNQFINSTDQVDTRPLKGMLLSLYIIIFPYIKMAIYQNWNEISKVVFEQ